MRIVLICDIFAPKKNSAAVQLGDLTTEFVNQGYEVTVLVASDQLDKPFEKIQQGLLTIVNLKTPKVTDVRYVRQWLCLLISFTTGDKKIVGEYQMTPFH